VHFASAVCLVLLARAPSAQAPPPAPAAAIEAKFRDLLLKTQQQRHFPGACAGFALPDDQSGAIAVGFEDDAGKVPLTTASKMFSGSIGKTYVAAVALQLMAEGKLQLDGKVQDVLGKQDWYARLPNHDAITFHQLLTHTSGIPEHVWIQEFQDAVVKTPDRAWTPVECITYILDKEPVCAPGAQWSYADTNYLVVGLAIEQVTGRKFYDLAQERLLTPLSLRDTLPSTRRDLPGLANGHGSGVAFFTGDTVVAGKYFVNPVFEWCGGGFCCTTRDLARWCKLLFSGKVIPKALQQAHLDGVPAPRGITENYGLGCFVTSSPHGPAYGHSGIMPGYQSYMLYYPELQVAVALQYNTDNPRQVGPMKRMVDELAGIVQAELAAAAGAKK